MSEGIPYADIVILALVAGFILLRLRSVLGTKSDDSNDFPKKDMRPQPADPIIQLENKNSKPKLREEPDPFLLSLGEDEKAQSLLAMKDADPQFSATAFVEGARRAFEMVFDAFAKGDKPTLKMLLSDALYDTFCKEIDAKEGEDERSESTLVSVAVREMKDASLVRGTARISLHFLSEQVTVVRNKMGEMIGGNPSEIHHVEDDWTFERDISSKNPNWKIIET